MSEPCKIEEIELLRLEFGPFPWWLFRWLNRVGMKSNSSFCSGLPGSSMLLRFMSPFRAIESIESSSCS